MGTLEDSDEATIRETARQFGEEHIKPNAMEYVESGEWPWEIFQKAADEGLIGVSFDEEIGGRGGSTYEESIVAEELCRADSSVGLALKGATIGCTAVAVNGTPEQREQWVTPVTNGEGTSGVGLTEPNTGSALTQVTTEAHREGDEYVINGEKDWIANGVSGDWIATLCRTNPETEKPHQGLSLIVVPTDADGYEAEPRNRLGLDAAEHATITYDNVKVPAENLVGGEEGKGFFQVLNWLKHGRVTIAAAHLGIAKGAFDRALEYSREREQGGQPINEYQGMRWKFADMRTKIKTAEAQTQRTARLVDRVEEGEEIEENLVEHGSIAKLYTTEIACDVAEEAVQVFGGNGYAREYEVEHFFRDAKVGTLYEGTSEIQRNTISRVVFDEL